MNITTNVLSNGNFVISLDEIETDPNMVNQCSKIIKHFTKGEELFFSLYREDGFLLNEDELIKFRYEIPKYFQINGQWSTLLKAEKNNKKYYDTRFLKAGSLPVNDTTYSLLPKVFHYFLETLCFCPKISWELFKEICQENIKGGKKDYIINGYTDFLFAYVDNGDFSITFNPHVFDVNIIFSEIINIIYD